MADRCSSHREMLQDLLWQAMVNQPGIMFSSCALDKNEAVWACTICLLLLLPNVAAGATEHTVCCVQVVQLPKYRAWVSSFGASTQHIMVNSQAVPNSFPLTSSATLQVSPPVNSRLSVWAAVAQPEAMTMSCILDQLSNIELEFARELHKVCSGLVFQPCGTNCCSILQCPHHYKEYAW